MRAPAARPGAGPRALALLVLLIALAPAGLARAGTRIRVGIQAEALVPFHVAADRGLFAAADLEVLEVLHGSGAAMLRPLSEGEVDVAYMALPPALVLWARGTPVEVILISHVSGSERLVARPDAGIAGVGDLRGKRVGVTLWTTAHLALLRGLANAGLTPGDLTIVHVLASQLPEAFAAGRVDAAWTGEPASGALNDLGGRTIATSASAAGLPSIGVWLARRDFAAAEPEAIVRFLAAIDRGIAAYEDDRRGALAVTARRLGRTPQAVTVYVARADLRFLTAAEQGRPAWLDVQAAGEASPFLAQARLVVAHMDRAGLIRMRPPDWATFVNEAPIRAYLDGRRR